MRARSLPCHLLMEQSPSHERLPVPEQGATVLRHILLDLDDLPQRLGLGGRATASIATLDGIRRPHQQNHGLGQVLAQQRDLLLQLAAVQLQIQVVVEGFVGAVGQHHHVRAQGLEGFQPAGLPLVQHVQACTVDPQGGIDHPGALLPEDVPAAQGQALVIGHVQVQGQGQVVERRAEAPLPPRSSQHAAAFVEVVPGGQGAVAGRLVQRGNPVLLVARLAFGDMHPRAWGQGQRQVAAQGKLVALLVACRYQGPLALGGTENHPLIAGAGYRRGCHETDAAIAVLRLQQAPHLTAEQVGGGVGVAQLHNGDGGAVGSAEFACQQRQVRVGPGGQDFFRLHPGLGQRRSGSGLDLGGRAATAQQGDAQQQRNALQSPHSQCSVNCWLGKLISEITRSAISFCPVVVKWIPSSTRVLTFLPSPVVR